MDCRFLSGIENMSWLYENFITWMVEFINGGISFFGELLNNTYVWMVETALVNEYVISAERFIIVTALMLTALMVIKIVIEGYMLETDYDSEADPFNLLIKVAQAVAVIMNANWLFEWLFRVGKDFTSDLLGSTDASGFSGITQNLLNNTTATPNLTSAAAWGIIMIAVVFVSMLVFVVISGLRAGELIAMKLLFPFFAIDLLSNSREIWGNFIRSYFIAFFSYALQLLFYIIALKSYATASLGDVRYYISTIVWMIVAIRSPGFLEKFIYKSGFSNAASGGMRMVVQSAIMRGAFR